MSLAASPPALPSIPADIGRAAGPLLLGYFFNWSLFGVLSMQVYMYFLAFPNDPDLNRLLVLGTYLFEATQTFLLTQTAFHSFADGFGNLTFLDQIGTIWFSVPIMSGIVAFVAQVFYAYRISILAQSKVMASFIMFLAFVQLGGAIATGVESKKAVLNSQFLGPKSYITTGIWNGGSAVCDAIIAICMTIYLKRRDTGMKQTQILLKKIIRLTIETGSLTAVIAILNFALALLPNHPTYYMTTAGMLGKLYSNSMMAVFNSRMKVGNEANGVTSSGNNVSVSSSSHHHNVGLRARNMDAHHGNRIQAGNAYEMSGPVSVAVTQEQVSFPPTDDWKVPPRHSDEERLDDKHRRF
ncbi:hypothetical protein D9613_011093 [Agrocybe pediades]|uniref:DUF6534 domain-containing protein n=1 Tax=Agrocybe pediades TaxID=84607 RepID=A0A8H4QLK0_9AGAR|nr:hypothetical protein D9613_011093 [Agrocybe pediades]